MFGESTVRLADFAVVVDTLDLGPLRLELRFDDTAPPPQQSSTGPWTEVGQGAD